MVESMSVIVNVLLSLMSVMSPPPALCNLSAPNDTAYRLQMTHPTRGGAVTAVLNCCANCVEPSHPQLPDLPFMGTLAMRTCWMAGAASHESG